MRVPGGFTEEDERVVMAFCWQAVLAVNTARLIEAKIRADQHRDALLEVTYAVSQELQVEDVLSIIVAKVILLLPLTTFTMLAYPFGPMDFLYSLRDLHATVLTILVLE